MPAAPNTSGSARGRATLRPRKTAALLAQRIVGEITDRGLEPGTPLPSERDMLEEYAVARGTLRESLRFLEMQGVLTIRTGPGGGPVVSRPGSRHLASTIAMMLQLEQVAFRSIVEARVVLEPELARRAATNATPEQLEALRASSERMRERIADPDVFIEENDTFHGLIAEAAGNPVFSMIITSLTWICDGTPLGVEYSEAARVAVSKEHARILRAVEAGDPERAGAAMAVHIGDFAAYLEAKYPRVLDATLRWDQVDL
ncbi:FadR/GntR family transcriptional regulator [Patulibacter sp.]|uniref:FadR/GntR family transcriptional regulator n=1 Tax=Patulibacter sp. TaxID=1912859 RepID=UPI00272060DD|nr:FadR/GntR family transcriptional regulator [Patulibacter sp.]MDO9408880.1 FadR/GntR family transcriptional regulator [Patulibacter sp.]